MLDGFKALNQNNIKGVDDSVGENDDLVEINSVKNKLNFL